jgi:hypothetical protein
MYNNPAGGLAGTTGAAALGGTGTAAGAAGAQPFTGVVADLIWVAMLGMLLVAMGVMAVRAGRLVTGERATRAQPFRSAAASQRLR